MIGFVVRGGLRFVRGARPGSLNSMIFFRVIQAIPGEFWFSARGEP